MEPDDSDWQALRYEISELFTPGPPIDEYDLFAGRKAQIQKLQDVVASKGRHAVIYGERGVGKTSLANIFFKQLGNGNRIVKSVRIQCDQSDTFETVWHKIFKRIKFTIDGEETWADETVYDELTPDMVQIVLSNFSLNDIPIIIIDEFDRIQSNDCKILISDTLKHLSDYAIHCTIIIVGVAESVMELIAGHQSITRALGHRPIKRIPFSHAM